MGVAGYNAELKLGGTPTAFTDEATTSLSSVRFQITDATKRVWNRTTLPTVKIDAVAQGSSTYDLDYLFGIVEFNTAPSSSTVTTVSGDYLPVGSSERIANCNSYELNLEGSILDASNFKDAQDNNGYMTKVLGLQDTSVSLGGFHNMSSAVYDAILNRDNVLFELSPSGSALGTYRGWFIPENKNISGGVDDLETEDISLQLDTDVTSEGNAVAESWSS